MTVTKLPTTIDLFIGQYSNPTAQLPTLEAPIGKTDTILSVSDPFLDEDKNIVPGGFEMGIRTPSGYPETVYVPVGAVSADGKTWGTVDLPVVRGVNPNGYDYLTGNSDFAVEHNTGEPIFCNIPANIPELIRSVIQGILASGSTSLILGIDSVGTVTLKRSTGVGTSVGFLRWDSVSAKTQFSDNGIDWTAISDAVASVIVKASNTDTTPSYLLSKFLAGSGITLTKNNSGGNETITISAEQVPQFTAAEDISAGAPVANTSTANNVENLNNNIITAGGSSVAFDSGGGVTYVAACNASKGSIAVIFKESGAWYVVAATISGASKTLVWGTRQQINAAADTVKPSCAYVSEGVVIFTYVDSSHNLKATVATLAGTVFTFGSEVSVKSATVTYPSVALVDTNKVMFAFNHNSGFGRVSIGIISGTTLTVDTADEQQFSSSTCTYISASKADTAKGFIAYANSSEGFGVAVSCSSTTPACGTAVAFETDVSIYNRTRYVSAGVVLVAYRDTSSNLTKAIVASISGTVVTYGSKLTVSSVASCANIDAVVYPSGKIFVGWLDTTNSKGSFQEVLISGTTLSNFLAPVDYYGSTISATTTVAMCSVNSNNKFAVLYVNNGTGNGFGVVYQDYSNTQLYIGIAQSTVVSGATVSVADFGIDTNQTGLTPGQNVNSQGITIGRALSATTMEIVVDNRDPSEVKDYAEDLGSTDDYQISLSPPWTSYVKGRLVKFKANTTNTEDCTLNINGLGAIAIRKNGTVALGTGDIAAGQIVSVIHDGTYFQLQSARGATVAAGIDSFSGSAVANNDVVIDVGFRPKMIVLEYYIQGHGSSGGSNNYTQKSGICTYIGTTLTIHFPIGVGAVNSDLATIVAVSQDAATLGTPVAPTTGDATGAGAEVNITITVPAVSDTGFTIRHAVATQHPANLAKSLIGWKAYA